MNSLLSLLKNHYATQLSNADALGAAPEIVDDCFITLSDQHAREVAQWVVQQNWQIDVEYQYEHIRYLASPGLALLDGLAKHGHADIICEVYDPSVSPANQVIIAHCLQVARNAYGVNDHRARSVILSCVENGDNTLVSQNFIVWMNDWTVASQAVKTFKHHNCPQAFNEALLEIGDKIYSALIHGVWDHDDTQMCQWVSSLLHDVKFASLLGSISGALEFVNDLDPSRLAFIEQKIQEVLSNCSLECAQTYMNEAEEEWFADRLLVLFPDRFKYQLAHCSIVEHTPNAQHIREHGTVYEAVIGLGSNPFTKKI